MVTIRSKEEVIKNTRDQKIDELITPLDTDPAEFKEAFKTKFKAVCDQIKAFLKLPEEEPFKGSLEDIFKLENYILSQDISTEEGKVNVLNAAVLEARWNSAVKLCRYLGGRLGYRQPQWFEEGWKLISEEEKDDQPASEETDK